MEDVRLVLDLVLALGAACVGGLVARKLGQPVLLGYVVAGALIGENTPGYPPISIGSSCWPRWALRF